MGNRRWLLVRTDYFTKQVEAEPLSNIRDIDAKSLFGRTLLLNLRFLTPSSRTTGSSLTVKPSGDTVVNRALGTYIQLQPICKKMGKLKQSTKS